MIIIDSYKYKKYLLNFFPATVAFSLRKLRSGQARAIRVRRSSDNAQQDIGFIGNELDTTSLLSFCGAGNGFVTTWYDQSGNGYNATQPTQANQPQIVSSGVVITENGKPAIQFNGAASLESYTSATGTGTYSGAMTIFFAGRRSTASGGVYFCERRRMTLDLISNLIKTFSFAGTLSITYITSDGANISSNQWISLATYDLTSNFFLSVQKHTPGIMDTLFINGVAATVLGNPGVASSITGNNGFRVGGRSDINSNWNGLISELLVYNTDQTANRAAIESNINTHYTIY